MDIKRLSDRELRLLARGLILRYRKDFKNLSQKSGVPEATMREVVYSKRTPQLATAEPIVKAFASDLSEAEVRLLILEAEDVAKDTELRKCALDIITSCGVVAEIQRRMVALDGKPFPETTIRNWLQEGRLPQVEQARRIIAAFEGEEDAEMSKDSLRRMEGGGGPAISAFGSPIVGTVGASANGIVGEVTMDQIAGTVTEVARKTTVFRLEVRDESMVPLAWPGQAVIVNSSLRVRSGDLAVIDIAPGEDPPELLFKRVRMDSAGHWTLESVNSSTKPIKLDRPPRAAYAVWGIQCRQG